MKKIERVTHKIYYDFQVNGFFSNNDVLGYGTEIHSRPEFLLNLTELLPHLKDAEDIWRKKSKGYIVTYLASLEQFAWYSFYAQESEYLNDKESKYQLKKWIISRAINRSFDGVDSHSGIFAYMGVATIIKTDQIIEYTEI